MMERPGMIVDEDRQLRCLRHGGEMRVEAALARLVVIGRHDEQRVGADPLGILGEPDRLVGGVGTGAGDHRHAAGRQPRRSISTTRRCSSWLSVGDSPVVPDGHEAGRSLRRSAIRRNSRNRFSFERAFRRERCHQPL